MNGSGPPNGGSPGGAGKPGGKPCMLINGDGKVIPGGAIDRGAWLPGVPGSLAFVGVLPFSGVVAVSPTFGELRDGVPLAAGVVGVSALEVSGVWATWSSSFLGVSTSVFTVAETMGFSNPPSFVLLGSGTSLVESLGIGGGMNPVGVLPAMGATKTGELGLGLSRCSGTIFSFILTCGYLALWRWK